MYIHVHISIDICMHTYTHTYTYTYTVHIYASIYAYVYTYICIYRNMDLLNCFARTQIVVLGGIHGIPAAGAGRLFGVSRHPQRQRKAVGQDQLIRGCLKQGTLRSLDIVTDIMRSLSTCVCMSVCIYIYTNIKMCIWIIMRVFPSNSFHM